MHPLPVEIYENIIDELAFEPVEDFSTISSTRRKGLWAACLTCKALLPKARFHLYRAVHIETHRISRLTSSIEENLSNGLLIRHILLTGAAGTDVVEMCNLPTELGPLLKNLKAITFHKVDFTNLPGSIYADFETLQSVRTIAWYSPIFNHPYEIMRLVHSFPSLQEIRSMYPLSNFGLGSAFLVHDNTGPILQHSIRVPKVQLRKSGPTPDPLLELVTPESVQDLSLLGIGDDQFYNALAFLDDCRSNLRSLTLDAAVFRRADALCAYLCCQFVSLADHSTLADPNLTFPHLETFEIRNMSGDFERTLPIFCRVLSKLRSPVLKCVRVLIFKRGRPETVMEQFVGWEALDAVLCQPNVGAARSVVVVVHAWDPINLPRPTPSHVVHPFLPRFAVQSYARFPMPPAPRSLNWEID